MKTVVQKIKEEYNGECYEQLLAKVEELTEVIAGDSYYFEDGSCLHDDSLHKLVDDYANKAIKVGAVYRRYDGSLVHAKVTNISGDRVSHVPALVYFGELYVHSDPLASVETKASFSEIFDIKNPVSL